MAKCRLRATVFFLLSGMSSVWGGSIGINYGQIADNLPAPERVVGLLKSINIQKAKLYDADPLVLRAFANSGVEFAVGLSNEYVSNMTDQAKAEEWVKTNVQAYLPATNITSIAVGNEVFTGNDTDLMKNLVPAMQNIHSALVSLGLNSSINVSTAHSSGILSVSYPPSAGIFSPQLTAFLIPLLDFLTEAHSPFLINAYPFFAYTADPNQIPLDYVLFQPNDGMMDNNLRYDNMLYAQIDSVYAALAQLGYHNLDVQISETGWPSKGDEDEIGATPDNAKTYNGNLLRLVSQNGGTPLRPNATLDTYVFALFNENLKTGKTSERNYGLFKPDGTAAYDLGLHGSLSGSSTPVSYSTSAALVVLLSLGTFFAGKILY